MLAAPASLPLPEVPAAALEPVPEPLPRAELPPEVVDDVEPPLPMGAVGVKTGAAICARAPKVANTKPLLKNR